jgi:RNA polymerase sigma factor (sigma-70 family)
MRPRQAAVRQLQSLFRQGIVGDLSDRQLLERFTNRDREAAECAFAALVERHGPMVLRVCRNLVSDSHDAQDAFQATFLVLVEQAHRLWVRDSLAPWLHRVAHRIASRTQASRRERREHERRAAESRPARFAHDCMWHELVTVLHEEIDLLPGRLRAPVVLCDLQGVTHERAARDLGWPLGTVKSRLVRARELLRRRLSRRGLVLPAGLLIAEVTANAAEAPFSLALVDSLIQAGAAFAARRTATLGIISSEAARLAEEVQKTMLMAKMKAISMVVLVGGSLAAGAAGVLAQQGGTVDRGSALGRGPTTRAHTAQESLAPQSSPVPPFIRQSRRMIVTRLEQERAAARERLDRTLRRVRSSTDPEVVHERKTVSALEDLLARIDVVLVDAVDKFPTIFDFSRGAAGSSAVPASNRGGAGSAKFSDSPATDDQHNKPAVDSTPNDPRYELPADPRLRERHDPRSPHTQQPGSAAGTDQQARNPSERTTQDDRRNLPKRQGVEEQANSRPDREAQPQEPKNAEDRATPTPRDPRNEMPVDERLRESQDPGAPDTNQPGERNDRNSQSEANPDRTAQQRPNQGANARQRPEQPGPNQKQPNQNASGSKRPEQPDSNPRQPNQHANARQQPDQPDSTSRHEESGPQPAQSSKTASAQGNPQSWKRAQSRENASAQGSQTGASKSNQAGSPDSASSQQGDRSGQSKDQQSSGARPDVRNAQDRVDWAKTMFAKGYVSQEQYDAAMRKYYETLRALLTDGVTSAVREEYEELKARFEQRPATQEAERTPRRGRVGLRVKESSEHDDHTRASKTEAGKPASGQEAGKEASERDPGKDRAKRPPGDEK